MRKQESATEYMVEFNFQNGKAMNIKFFDHRWKAEKFAEENNGQVYEMISTAQRVREALYR